MTNPSTFAVKLKTDKGWILTSKIKAPQTHDSQVNSISSAVNCKIDSKPCKITANLPGTKLDMSEQMRSQTKQKHFKQGYTKSTTAKKFVFEKIATKI